MCPVLLSPFTPSLNPVFGKHTVAALINSSPCLTRVPLSFFIFPVSLLLWSFLLCPFSCSRGHLIPSLFFFLQFLTSLTSFSFAPSLSIFFITIFTFSSLSVDDFPQLISLAVSFPHVYLALSLSLVVSSLGKLKRCEEGNKSKSKKCL